MGDSSQIGSFQAAEKVFSLNVQDEMLMCMIYSAYAGPELTHHNCLGDNFNDLTRHLHKFLEIVGQTPNVFDYHESFAIYSHLVNATWERISDIFAILSVPESYIARHFSCFILMRRWANFFKHPKEFAWLVCFPKYLIQGTDEQKAASADTSNKIVDDAFLKKYYAADRSKGLATEFASHRDKVVVLLPDVVSITERICKELHTFVNVVTKNPVYFEILNDKATIIDYYESESHASTTITTSTTTTTPAP